MTKDQFLSGVSFRALANTVFIYKYSPRNPGVFDGFIYRILPSGREFPIAVVDEICEKTFKVSFTVLGLSYVHSLSYDDFEINLKNS